MDVVSIARFEAVRARYSQFDARWFSPLEVARVGQGPLEGARLAARFAAKEALIKAAGGLYGSSWRQIEVLRRSGQAPTVTVDGPLGEWLARRRARVWLSLSHEREWAAATVLLEASAPTENGHAYGH